MSSTTVFAALLGSGFQQWTFPSSGSPNCPRPELPASATVNWLCACRLSLSLLFSGLFESDSIRTNWYYLYSLGMDRTENTNSNNSYIVAAFTWWLLSHCLATGVFTEPFLSNGCLCWLHNSVFQQICLNIYFIRAMWVYRRRKANTATKLYLIFVFMLPASLLASRTRQLISLNNHIVHSACRKWKDEAHICASNSSERL
jgi:hypothetical protein